MKISPKVKKALTAAAYIFVALLIVFVFIILFLNINGKTVFIGGRSAMWVKTESMSPEIPPKSYILVKKATADDIKVGDVIVFRSSDPAIYGQLNTHRVIEIVNDGAEFVTKGDNNPGKDNYTAKANNIIGIYEKKLPLLSFFGRFLSTPGGITVTVFLILVITGLVYLPDIIGGLKEKKKEAKIDNLIKAEVEKLKAESRNDPENNKKE